MHHEVTTTVRVRLHSLTRRTEQLLSREDDEFQRAVHGDKDVALYSATKQQAGKVRTNKHPREDTTQPVVLRNDCLTIERDDDTVLSDWWCKVPVYDPDRGRGNSIWCPAIVPEKDESLLEDKGISDSELVRKDDNWYVHLVCTRSVAVDEAYDDVLAVRYGGEVDCRQHVPL